MYKHLITTTLPYTNDSMYKVAWNKLVYHLSLSYKSIFYEQTLHNKDLQLTELQFYINKITRYLNIVNILSARREYDPFNTFTSVILSHK